MRLDQYTRNIGLSPEIGAAPMQGNPSPFEGLSPLAEGLAQKAADIQRRNKILEQQMQIDHATTEQEIWQIDYLDRALKKQEGFSLEGYEEAARKKNEELLSTVTDEYAKKETNLILNKKMAYGNIAVKKAQQAIFEEKVQEEANRRIQSGKDMYVAAVMNPKERIRIYSEVAGGITVSLKAMGRDKDFIDDQLKTIRQNYDLSALQMDIQADPYAAEEAYKRGDYAIDVGDKGAEVERVIKANIEAKETDTYNLLREQIEANPNAPVNTSMLRDEAKVKNLENYRKAERRQQYLQERAMQAQAQADRTEALERDVALAMRDGSMAKLIAAQGRLDSSFQGIDPTRYSVMSNMLDGKRSQIQFNDFALASDNGTNPENARGWLDFNRDNLQQEDISKYESFIEKMQDSAQAEAETNYERGLLMEELRLMTDRGIPADVKTALGDKIKQTEELLKTSDNPSVVYNNFLSYVKSLGVTENKMGINQKMLTGQPLDTDEAGFYLEQKLPGMVEGQDVLSYAKTIGVGTQGKPTDDQYVNTIVGITSETGRVAKNVTNSLSNAVRNANADPAGAKLALKLYQRIKSDNSTKQIAEMDMRDGEDYAVMLEEFEDNLKTTADVKQAWNDAFNTTHPDPATKKERQAYVDKNLSSIRDHLYQHQAKWYNAEGWDLPMAAVTYWKLPRMANNLALSPFRAGERIPEFMESDYTKKYERYYLESGNETKAKDKALQWIGMNYGVTGIGNVYMKHPPEQFIPDKDVDKPQIIAEMRDILADEVFAWAGGAKMLMNSGPNTEYAKEASFRDSIRLRVKKGTESQGVPRYDVFAVVNGKLEFVKDISGKQYIEEAKQRIISKYPKTKAKESFDPLDPNSHLAVY